MPVSLAERLPVGGVVAQVHHLVVRAAVGQPAVQALAQPGRGPELPVRHLQGRQFLAVQVLALGDHQPEAIALQRDQRGQRGRPRLVLEQERGRVGQPPDAQRPLDQLHRPVGPGDLPVALAHVALQDRVRGEVHRVHLGEVRVADQHVPGGDQAGGEHVAFGRVPVALGHQRRRRGQRQPGEPAVFADRVEVRGVGAEPPFVQDLLDRHLHPGVVRPLLSGKPRVDLEVLVLEGDDRGDRVVAGLLHAAPQVALRDRDDRRAEGPDQRVLVDPDVAHLVHRVAEDGDLELLPRGGRGRRAGPAPDVGPERGALPVIGQHGEPLPGPDHGVGRVLRAVHALVVGHVGHVPGGRHAGFRLDVGQADGQPGLREQPRHPHGRAVGEHDDDHAVQVRVLELAHGALGVLAVLDGLARRELRDVGQVGGEFRGVPLLPLRDPGNHVVVQVLHDPENADARLTPVKSGHELSSPFKRQRWP